MNIAEAERRTGLTRANIRFYEKEGLLTPTRGANGYRDYTASGASPTAVPCSSRWLLIASTSCIVRSV